MQLTQWPIQMTIPVKWGDMDAFQHVNNTHYIRWFECVRIEYFMKIAPEQLTSNKGIGPILAHIDADYHFPVTFPDNVTAQTAISKVGHTSFTMEYLVTSQKHQRPAATGSGVIVMIDYQSGEKSPMQQSFIDKIQAVQGSIQSYLQKEL